MTNLNHWCDPDRNHFPKIHIEWPKHKLCSGEEVIEYGTKREEIVKCECDCHKEEHG